MISSIISPIKSRTFLVRVAAPSTKDIADILGHIAKKELVKFTSDDEDAKQKYLEAVAASSGRNLRRALLSFETLAMQQDVLDVNNLEATAVALDWESIIINMARSVMQNKTVANLGKLRMTFYELLSHCIPARLILKELAMHIMRALGNDTKRVVAVIELAAVFDERLSLGLKAIFHLEGFVAKTMVALS